MMKKYEKSFSIQQVFVMLVLAIFMVFSMLMVVLGAMCYVGLEERSQNTNDQRILCSFVRSTLHTQEEGGNVLVEGDKLILEMAFDEEDVYRQYLYMHDGQLRQQFISTRRSFLPENGDVVCPAQQFSPRLEGNLLIVEMQDGQGNAATLYETVKTAPAEGGSL